MLTSETKRRIDACRDVLVGKLPLPTDQVELITLALIYKFMDDLDDESVKMGGKRSFFIGAIAKYKWSGLLAQKISADERVRLFAEALEAMSDAKKAAHLPALFRDIFRNAFLKFRDGRILTMFLTEINAFSYSHSEELGNAFEYLLQTMGTQGENGQFRTPRHIIDFMVECLDPQPGDRILDPACGTGGFLVSAYKHILKTHTSKNSKHPGDSLTHAERKQVYTNLTGYDITDLMVKLSKVNLFLHGFPDPAIHIYDTLSNDARWNEKADVILANPPFMTPKGGVTPHAKFRIAAKKAEVLFTDYIAEHLTPDGRAAVIVPNGIVATTQNAYVKLRKFLVEDSLVAVVSLPAGVFKPYSGVKTSILFLDKGLARNRDKILFLKINADGFDLGDKRGEIEANDLPEAKFVVRNWITGGAIDEGPTIPFTRVERSILLENNDVSLTAERFLGIVEEQNQDNEIVRLGDVCETTSGGTPLKSNLKFYENGTIPWLKSGEVAQGKIFSVEENITELGLQKSSAKLFPIDTVLVAMYGATAGQVGLLKIPSTTNQAVCGILPNDKFVPVFLYYHLRSRSDEMKLLAGGGAQPNISQQIIKNLEIPLVSLDEQRRIVEEIEGYQKVIDGARGVVEGWRPRIDVDPEWEMIELGEVAEMCGGGTPSKSNASFWKGTIPWVSPKDMKVSEITDAEDHISQSAVESSATTLVHAGTIFCVVRSGILQHTLPVAITMRDMCFNQDLIAIIPNRKMLDPRFLFYVLKTFDQEILRDGIKTGVTVQSFHNGFFKTYPIPLPSLLEQHSIVAELDAEAAQIEVVRGLIPKFEGKIARVLGRVWGEGASNGRG